MSDFRFIEIDHGEEEQDDDVDINENNNNNLVIPVHVNLFNQLDDNVSDTNDDDDVDINDDVEDDSDDVENDFDDVEDYDDDDSDVDYEGDLLDYEEELLEYEEEMDRFETTLGSVSEINDGVVEVENVVGVGVDEEVEEWSGRGDGLFCTICYEGWTSGGEHQMCCLPCGHIYGLSCIKKWLECCQDSGKCPQCKSLCTLKDVRVLYASRLCVADEELHSRVRSLEAKCAYLEQKAAPLTPEELIDQICSNPTLVQRLAVALSELHQ